MCWSKEASLFFAIAGGCLLIKKRMDGAEWIEILPLTLYVMMELLQFRQYDTVNDCRNKENVTLTKLSYVLVWLQPVVWNWHFYLKTGHVVFEYTMLIAILVMILAFDRVFTRIIYKRDNNALEAHNTGRNCTLMGKWHLFWTYDMKTGIGLEPNFFVYFLLLFAGHLYLRDSQHFVKSLVTGIVFVLFMIKGSKAEEFTSMWCAWSIPYMLLGEYLST